MITLLSLTTRRDDVVPRVREEIIASNCDSHRVGDLIDVSFV